MHKKSAHWGAHSHMRRLFEHFWLSDESGPDKRPHKRPHKQWRRGGGGPPGGGRGGPMGGRRPLRFLARKLGLDEEQFETISVVFSQIKTERAQAAVDRRRAAALYADAMSSESFDADKAAEAAKLSTSARARIDELIAKSLATVHAVLDERQRSQLASILRELPLGGGLI